MAEAEQRSAKTDEVETCTNPVRDLNQIDKEKSKKAETLCLNALVVNSLRAEKG